MMKATYPLRKLLLALLVLAVGVPASAAITLYDQNGTTFSTDGSFNTFYVYSDSDKNDAMGGPDRAQSRVKMGFLPNWIGFNFGKQTGDLKLGGRSSFWVTINDSDSTVTSTGIDVRQFYGTVDAAWGQVLLGKDFTLFNRSNIFLDEILLGYGNVSDTLGLIDGTGVSFGNIGTGYTYPMPTSQITYRTPTLAGFLMAIGVIDPSHTSSGADAEESTPRIEGELTYNYAFDNGSVTAWGGFLSQNSKSDTADDVESRGYSYGVRGKIVGLSVHASGFTGQGLGHLLGPGADPALGIAFTEGGDEVDTSGYLLQGSYTFGPARVVASYGSTTVDYDDEWQNQTITGAVFYSVNANFILVGEYNMNTIEIDAAGDDPKEETGTLALGAIINF
jgi:predicted porin